MATTWQGKPIASDEDVPRLDAKLAHAVTVGIHEPAAIDRLHREYSKDTHERAAAHHAKSAQLLDYGGRQQEGDKHRTMMKMHLAQAGYNPRHGLPASVKTHLVAIPSRKLSYFEPHLADKLLGASRG